MNEPSMMTAFVGRVVSIEDNEIKDIIRFEVPGVTDNVSTFPYALPLQDSNSEVMPGDTVLILQPNYKFKSWFYVKINHQDFYGIQTRSEENYVKLDNDKGIELKDKFGNILTMGEDGIQFNSYSSELQKIGNDVDTLGNMISTLLDILMNMTTYGSPGLHAVHPETIAKLQQLQQTWNQVFS